MVDSAKKYVSKYIIFLAGFASQGVLNKDPTILTDGARTAPRYVSRYMKIKIPELYINNIQFGDKTFQQWKLTNSFVRESYSYAGQHKWGYITLGILKGEVSLHC
jgi:hypothetical protein